MAFSPLEIVNFAIKIVELLMIFIVMMVTRFAGNPTIPIANLYAPSKAMLIDSRIFGYVTIFGFFYIILIQLIANASGESSPRQNLLHAVFGFLFFLSAGSVQINSYNSLPNADAPLGQGSMCILTSFVFLGDAALTAINVMKGGKPQEEPN